MRPTIHPTALAAVAVLTIAACDGSAGRVTGTAQPNAATETHQSHAWSGSRIAFSSDRDAPGSAEIYVMNADGSDQRQLTSTPGNSNGPALSPNGRRIAFHSNRGGGTDIYLMDVDGGDVIRLTNLTALGPSAHFANWSPDGQQVVFNSFVQPRDIYVVNTDGTGLTNLTNHSSDDLRPDWSPDGRTIAFVSNRDGNQEIYLMTPDGTEPVRLTFSAGADANPDWSPNGRRIAFESNRDGNSEIYVMNADGSAPVRLTEDLALDTKPSWSPDGQRIAFHRQVAGHFEVFTMDADGTNVTRLTESSPGFSGFASWGQGHAMAPSGVAAAAGVVGGLQLAAPSNTGAAALSTTQIDVSWRDNSGNETTFEVHRSSSGESGMFDLRATLAVDATAFRDQGLGSASRYCYKIRAVRLTGNKTSYSGFSNTACATTLTPPPNAASGAAAAPINSSLVAFSWRDNSTNEEGFRIYRSIDGGATWSLANTVVNSTRYQDSALQSEKQVCYRVVAFNAGGDAAPSNSACTTPPAAPTNLVGTVDGGSVNVDLTWSDNSAVEEKYQVWGYYADYPPCEEGGGCDAGYYEFNEVIAELAANSTTYRCEGCAGYMLSLVAVKDGGRSDAAAWIAAP